MNIKKIFIPWMFLTVVSSITSIIQLFLSGGSLIWLGALVAALPLPAYLMGYIMREKTARTPARLPVLQAITLLGLAIAIYALINQTVSSATDIAGVAIAINGAVFVQWFVWVFSSYGREKSGQIVIGKPLPELALQSLKAKAVSSTTFVGHKTLLVFFRANWCPLCMAQLQEIRDRADRLAKAGVQVKFISNQGIEQSKKLQEKLDLPSHYEILQDDDLLAAKTLHIEDMGGAPVGMGDFPSDTVMATVIALDEKGLVIFGDETDNYRVRPHPDTFLDIFETASSSTAEPLQHAS